jgi:hypothetical protein
VARCQAAEAAVRVWSGGRGHGHALERMVFRGFDDGVVVAFTSALFFERRGFFVLFSRS